MHSFSLISHYAKDSFYIPGDVVRKVVYQTARMYGIKPSLTDEQINNLHFILFSENSIYNQYSGSNQTYLFNDSVNLSFIENKFVLIDRSWVESLFKAVVAEGSFYTPCLLEEEIREKIESFLPQDVGEILKKKRVDVFSLSLEGYNWLVQEYQPVQGSLLGLKKYLGRFSRIQNFLAEQTNIDVVSSKCDAHNSYPLITFLIEEHRKFKIGSEQVFNRIENSIKNRESLSLALKEEFGLSPWMVKRMNNLTIDVIKHALPGENKPHFDQNYGYRITFKDLESQPPGLLETIQTVGQLKPEFYPQTEEHWKKFGSVLSISKNLYGDYFGCTENSKDSEQVRFLLSVKGQWDQVVEKEIAHLDLNDVVTDLVKNLFNPLMLRLNFQGNLQSQPSEIARRFLWKGISLSGLVQCSKKWHNEQRAIHERLAAKFPKDKNAINIWPALIEDWTASNGYTFKELCSRELLREEGLNMHHCVGGYADNCIWQNTHIVRVQSSDGSNKSTVELRDNLNSLDIQDFTGSSKPVIKLRVVQHRSEGNKDPTDQAVDALKELLNSIETNMLATNYEEVRKWKLKIGLTRTPGNRGIQTEMVSCYGSDTWESLEEAWREYCVFFPKQTARLELKSLCDLVESETVRTKDY